MSTMRIDNKDLLMMKMLKDGNPSIHEMREAIRARSTGTVAHRLKKLETLGYVVQPKVRQPRSREVTERGDEVLKGAGIQSETV